MPELHRIPTMNLEPASSSADFRSGIAAEQQLICKIVERLRGRLADGRWPRDEIYDCFDFAKIASTERLRGMCRRALAEAEAFRRQVHTEAGTAPTRRIVDERFRSPRPPIVMKKASLHQHDNGVFYVHWTEGRRSKRLSTHKRTLAEAQIALAARCPTFKPTERVENTDPTCGALWALYLKNHVRRNLAGEERHRYAWLALAPTFAELRPRDVTQEIIDIHVARRFPVKPSSVRLELTLLQASWSYGIKKRAILSTAVPATGDLEIPKAPPPRHRWLREEEADRLFQAAALDRPGGRLSRVERFIWLALFTAGRRDALLTLKWDQVDLETLVIHLNPDGREQTSKRRASVPISDALLVVLRRAWDERQTEYVLDRSNRLHELLDQVAERARVEGVTAHVFRHTAATWMARRGVPLWQIAKVLGNTVDQVERVYAKHSPDDLRDAVNVISSKLRLRLV